MLQTQVFAISPCKNVLPHQSEDFRGYGFVGNKGLILEAQGLVGKKNASWKEWQVFELWT